MMDKSDRRTWPTWLDRPVIAPSRFALFDRIVFATFVIALPLVLATSGKIFKDGDTSWHVATGRWIIAHGRVPTSDPFSFTMPGHPWVAHEWGADLLFAAAFGLAGFAGLAALFTLALTALLLIVFRHGQRSVGPIGILITLSCLIVALGPFALARPHVLVWPLMAWWTSSLLRKANRGLGPPWWLPALMVLWVNLHASFVLGFVIYAAAAGDALISRHASPRLIKRWLVIGAFCVAATLINANGGSALLFPFTVTRMATLHLIDEWRSSAFSDTPFFFVILVAVVGLALFKGVRVPLFRLGLLLVLLGMAFVQVRHQASLAIVAALILPACLAGAGRRGAPGPVGWTAPRRLAQWALITVPSLLVLALPIVPPEGPANPRSLIAAVPHELRSKPVFNEYSFGGPLIMVGIRPYIDGRADMYGDAFFAEYAKISEGDMRRFQRAVDRYAIGWTMLQTSNTRLIEALDASPQWQRLHSDKVGVIHVRRTATHGT